MLSVGFLSSVTALWVIVVPTDQLPGNYPPDQVYLHECGHTLGAIDGRDALISGTPLWVNPKYDCTKHPIPLGTEINRYPTEIAIKVCRIYGGLRYACAWKE